MNIQEIKDLMSQFDQSSLREFTYQNATDVLSFSKNSGSVASLQPAGPDKPAFVQVGDSVSKGQTLLIIEAMKVMNEVPAPRDGIVTEILVSNEEMVEFGKGLVRIK